jgi:hypothetical protein
MHGGVAGVSGQPLPLRRSTSFIIHLNLGMMAAMNADLNNPPAIVLDASDAVVPALIAALGRHAGRRFVEFFTANIRNSNTRKAYYRPARKFLDWCD